jgi:hypothetical protein
MNTALLAWFIKVTIGEEPLLVSVQYYSIGPCVKYIREYSENYPRLPPDFFTSGVLSPLTASDRSISI